MEFKKSASTFQVEGENNRRYLPQNYFAFLGLMIPIAPSERAFK